VFAPYHQLGTSCEKGSRGLGLGLSIVRSLGELLGHDVTARSRLGQGSVFRIRVPLAQKQAATTPAAALPSAPQPPPAGRPAHILLIDDDTELLDLLGQMLSSDGHDVVKAAGGVQAMAALKAKVPDLIISDFRLNDGRDGLELAQTLRAAAMAGDGRRLPVIMLTGDISIDTLTRFAADDCMRLSKPVRPAALLAAVQAALNQKALALAAVAPGSLVHVIDDDPALLRELSHLLAGAGLPARLHGSAEHFRANWVPEEAGCLLIDAALPGESGLELLKALGAAGTLPPTILITGRGEVGMAVEAMKAGALDFIEKPASGQLILECVRRAIASGQNRAAQDSERDAAAARLATLTGRQSEVMTMVLAGHPSKNIAADLGLSQRTVENHRAEIMRRTGCRSLPELARLVMTADPGG
jgi:two-component system CheB/CheR fusion protein